MSARCVWLFACVTAMIAGLLHQTGLLERFDRYGYDLQVPFSLIEPDADVVVVGIDQRSLDGLGRWPWPRGVHATLIDQLSAGGAAAIGLDLILSERDQHDPAGDQMLVDAVARAGNVVLPVFPERLGSSPMMTEIMSFPELTDAAAAMGHVDVEVDPDGLVRSSFLYGGVGEPVWQSLALAVLSTGIPDIRDRLPALDTGDHQTGNRFGWNRALPHLIPFVGPAGSFKTYSYIDVLRGGVPKGAFEGRMVLIGATAPGLGDIVTTPVTGASKPLSGVELTASMINGLKNSTLRQPVPGPWAAMSISALTLMFLWASQWRRFGWMAYILGPVLLMGLSTLVLTISDYWLPPTAAIMLIMISYPIWLFVLYFRERRLRLEDQERAHATLMSINEGILVISDDNVILYANPWISEFIGRPAVQLAGLALSDVIAPELIERASRSPARKRNAGDEERWIKMRVSETNSEQTSMKGTVLVVSDVTREQKAERRLRASQERLRQLESQIQKAAQRDIMGQVSASIAHEVNQPLTALLTYANACQRLLPVVDDKGNEKLASSLSKIVQQTERTGNVVRRVRSLFENREFEPEPVDLNGLLLEAMSLSLIGWELDTITIHRDLAEDLPAITIDPVQIQQVLVNLVRNALDAMQDMPDRRIWIRSRLEGPDYAVIEIEDNGGGVSDELRAALFEPFVTTKAGGMGIGLSISKAIVDAHQGELELLPRRHLGAHFRITLPQSPVLEPQNV